MDVEKTMQFILESQARSELRTQRAEERADRADRRMDRFDTQLKATEKLVRAGMKMVMENRRLIKDAALQQKRTESNLDRFIASLRGKNGHR